MYKLYEEVLDVLIRLWMIDSSRGGLYFIVLGREWCLGFDTYSRGLHACCLHNSRGISHPLSLTCQTVRVFTTCGLLGGVQRQPPSQAVLVRLAQRCKQLFVNVRSVKKQIILHLKVECIASCQVVLIAFVFSWKCVKPSPVSCWCKVREFRKFFSG